MRLLSLALLCLLAAAVAACPDRPPAAGCGCNGACCACGEDCGCKLGRGRCCASCDCLVAGKLPPGVRILGSAWRTAGVEADKIEGGPRYLRRGREISRPDALKLVEGKQLPDDGGKNHLTVIGPEAERKRVLDDLDAAPELAGLKARLKVQAYPPDHWAVSKGHVTSGRPTIYVQAPDRSVLHRQDDYDGPGPLAEAIRKADPDYRPEADPDLRRPQPSPAVPPALSGLWERAKNVPPAAVVLAALAALVLWPKGGKS